MNLITIEDVDHDCRPRRFRNGAGIVAGISLTGVGDVEATDGAVWQQVSFDAARTKKNEKSLWLLFHFE